MIIYGHDTQFMVVWVCQNLGKMCDSKRANKNTFLKIVRVRWLSRRHDTNDFRIVIFKRVCCVGATCIASSKRSISSSPPVFTIISFMISEKVKYINNPYGFYLVKHNLLKTLLLQHSNRTMSWIHLEPPLSRKTVALLLFPLKRIISASKIISPNSKLGSRNVHRLFCRKT